MCACLCLPCAGGSGSSSTPWIATGRTGKEGETAVLFRGGFELEGFTFDLKPQPLGFLLGSLGL